MDSFGAQKNVSGQEFKSLVLRSSKVEGQTYVSCTFSKCSFRETAFQYVTFQDCSFRTCDLSAITLKDCTFKSTRFEDSTLVGVNWMETNLAQTKYLLAKPVDFVRCALNHSTFMGLNLKNVLLTLCVAADVSFEDANLTRSNATYTDFNGSRFLHTDLTEADFTGATNYTIPANLNTLKKTKFSMPEAMALLYSLDIVLTENPN